MDISKKAVIAYVNDNTDKKAKNEIVNQLLKTVEINRNIDKDNISLAIRGSFFILNLDGKKTYIIAYVENDNKYNFVGVIDSFITVQEIFLVPLRVSSENIVLVREFVDALSTSGEVGTFLRGYIYTDEAFEQIVSIVESFKAYSEGNFVSKNEENSRWQRIMSSSNIRWRNEKFPLIEVTKTQTHSLSSYDNEPHLPQDEYFDTIKTREIESTYYWSQKFRHFILAEGHDRATSEEVAILDDLSHSPFSLISEFSERNKRYLVKYINGDIRMVEKSSIQVHEGGISIR